MNVLHKKNCASLNIAELSLRDNDFFLYLSQIISYHFQDKKTSWSYPFKEGYLHITYNEDIKSIKIHIIFYSFIDNEQKIDGIEKLKTYLPSLESVVGVSGDNNWTFKISKAEELPEVVNNIIAAGNSQ